jgi:DNA-binding Lrp family transcriptional regulator
MRSDDASRAPLDATDALLIDRLQGDLPLTERPFADVGAELGLSEDEVIERLHHLLGQGVLTRFGPLFHIERAGGQFLLAAVEVPEADFARVTAIVNALPEVAHNYRREHKLNMWFVVAAETPAAVEKACRRIEAETGLAVHRFPKEREYFVGLRLPASMTTQRGHANGAL